jgi:hypothetical protein
VRAQLIAAASLACLLTGAGADAQEFGYIDANALPASAPGAPFFAIPHSRPTPSGQWSAGLRSSVLLEPISGSQPSPDPQGTDTAVVSCLWLQELALAVGVGAGIDVSLALPIHLLQSGQGLTGAGIGDGLDPIAVGDVRLGVGVGLPLGDWSLRPFGAVYLPTGQEQEFAGERLPRGDLGVAVSVDAKSWTYSGAVAARLREASTLSNVGWSSQAILTLGARYLWSPYLDTSLEVALLPTLGPQPEPMSGSAGVLLPAEVLLGAHHRKGSLALGVFAGTGLPLSVAPVTGGLVRGPTSPILRAGVEIGTTF